MDQSEYEALVKEEERKLKEFLQSDEEDSESKEDGPGLNYLLQNFFDLTDGQKDLLLHKIGEMPVLSKERTLTELHIAALACVENITKKINTEVNSARLTAIADLRLKVLGEFKASTSIDIEEKVEEKTRLFVERGIHHLVALVSEDIARKLAKLMGQQEGF